MSCFKSIRVIKQIGTSGRFELNSFFQKFVETRV